MKYAKIENGVITQVQPYMEDGFVQVPDDAIVGMLWDGEDLSLPTKTPSEILQQCKDDLSSKRWDIENGGVTIDGTPIQTDEKSQNSLSRYVTESITNGLTEVHWKLSDGSFQTYTIAQLKKVHQICAKYQNDCFGIEKSKAGEMDIAADPTTVDIEAGWPTTTFITV